MLLFPFLKGITTCTLLTRRSASVLKMGKPSGSEGFIRRVAYSVTVIISATIKSFNYQSTGVKAI